MRKLICCWTVLVAALFAAPFVHAQATDTLVVYTENYPPFNFQKDDGSIGGLATERVRQILDAAGLKYEIKVLPWARAINRARADKNALIYTITRTPRREFGFDWLALLAESNFHLFGRADETRKVTPEALRAGEFTASCVSGDLACELLIWAGVPVSKIIPISEMGTGDFKMVIAGRADLYISDLAANIRLRKAEGFDPSLTKPMMRLDSRAGFYLAAGLHVAPDVREKIKSAYEQLKASGNYRLVTVDSGNGDGR